MVRLERTGGRQPGTLQRAIVEAFGQKTRATRPRITRDKQCSWSGDKRVGDHSKGSAMRSSPNQWHLRIRAAESQAPPSIMPDSIGKGAELPTRLLSKLCLHAGDERMVGGERACSIARERSRADE
jgi:hypothetical protein